MAIGTDRYAPLRDPTPGTASPTQEAPPSEEIGKSRPAIEQTAAAHDTRQAAIAIDEQGQPTRWPMQQDMRSQTMAAQELVKQRHEQRQKSQQEPEQEAPEPQQGEAKRELSFFEDKNQQPARNYGELKREDADRTLSFYEDRNPADPSRTL
jgi:hypothetical protein